MDDLQYNRFDLVQLYYGQDYQLTEKITIHQPSVLDVIRMGEDRFWSLVTRLCANPTTMRLALWELGIDWNKITEFRLFSILAATITKEESEIIFGDFDLSQLKYLEPENEEEGEPVLVYLPDPEIIVNEEIYKAMVSYLRTMFDFHPKVEKASNKWTKEALIQEEKQKIADAKKIEQMKSEEERNKPTSSLLQMLSFALCHPGFKYKKSELAEVGIYEFMESIKRIQNTESVLALMHGMYSGMIDMSGIDTSEELNLFKELQ